MTAITVIDERENPIRRAPLVEGDNDFASVTNTIARVAESKTPRTSCIVPSPTDIMTVCIRKP